MSVIQNRPPPARSHSAARSSGGPARRGRWSVRRGSGTFVVGAAAVLGLLFAPVAGAAEAPVGLGAATSFAILAGQGITNTGPTTIDGDVGTFPLASTTGFGSVTLNGVDHGGDGVTQQAKTDLVTAYGDAAGRGPATPLTPVDLAGRTLTPGVYSGGALALSGNLTLDTLGDPDAVFVFQAASSLTTSTGSTVTVIGGDAETACNIYWKVGSSATLGGSSDFVGTVLALTSITLVTGAEVEGRLLAQNGAVTLDNNVITNTGCATIAPTPTTTPTTTTPGDTTASDGSTAGGSPTGGPDGSGDGGGDGSGRGSGTPGSGTPTTDLTRTLAFTGTDGRVPAAGVVLVLAGLVCVTVSVAGRDRSRRAAAIDGDAR